MPLTASDAELIDLLQAIARQDEGALKRLYDRVAPTMYGLALRVLRQRDWAEDALQEAFLTIWRNAGDYRAALSPPLAWIGLIVRSRALDLLRRRASERADTTETLDDALEETLAGDTPDPLSTADASQQARALHACLQGLEYGPRQALSLAYLRDLSHGELAAQLRQPLGTVKSWIRRGLDQLRRCMAGFA